MRTLVHDYSKTDILTRLVQMQSCKINVQKCHTVYKDYKSYTQIKLQKKGWLAVFSFSGSKSLTSLVKSLTSLITGKMEKSHIYIHSTKLWSFIHKVVVRARLSLWSGLKWLKFLFPNAMGRHNKLWCQQVFTRLSLKIPFTCCADKTG